MKVLTVDDSRMIRTLVRKYLAGLNLEIVEAENGEIGLAKALEESPDLIILDVNMPIMDGSQMLKELRSREQTRQIKVLMLTAESAQKLVLELIKLGISDYIVKPFEEEVLFKKVCKLLQIDPSKIGAGIDDGLTKVLVVDDNESILMVARKFLAGVAEVVTTSRPEKALQLASQHSPSVVLLDLQTDGVNVLGQLKKETGLGSPKFVCLATKSGVEQLGDVQQMGFSDVLYKPFDKETLTKVISG